MEEMERRVIALEDRCRRLERDVLTLTGWAWANAAALATLAMEADPRTRLDVHQGQFSGALENGSRTTIADERLDLVQPAIREAGRAFHRALMLGSGTSL